MATQQQLNLWELEYIKCNSPSKLKSYIKKYKNNIENPYVEEAIRKLGEGKSTSYVGGVVSTTANNLLNEINENIEEINSSSSLDKIKGIAAIVFIAIAVGIGFYVKDNWREWGKRETASTVSYPVVPMPSPSIKKNEEAVTEEKIDKAKKGSKTIQNGALQPYYPVVPSYTVEPGPTVNSVEGPDPSLVSMYNELYSRLERLARDEFNSLTRLGIQYNNNGNREGITNRDDIWVVQQKNVFTQYQHQMRDLRHEASTKGINIPESPLETAIVNL